MAGERERRRVETRRLLLDSARTGFARDGFAAVSLQGLVAAAGVTKGALYHHYTSKEQLFAEVVEQAHGEVARLVEEAASREQGGWRGLLAGCEAFVAGATDERRRRVLLVDGPAVLGWDRWRELDEVGAGASLRTGLQELVDAGVLAPHPVEALTRVLSGAMNEAALWVAAVDGDQRGLRVQQTSVALRAVLEGLRPPDR